jgi:hypothetical protein
MLLAYTWQPNIELSKLHRERQAGSALRDSHAAELRTCWPWNPIVIVLAGRRDAEWLLDMLLPYTWQPNIELSKLH